MTRATDLEEGARCKLLEQGTGHRTRAQVFQVGLLCSGTKVGSSSHGAFCLFAAAAQQCTESDSELGCLWKGSSTCAGPPANLNKN